MTSQFPVPAWIVGCGNMAGALLEGWRVSKDLSHVTVIRPSGKPVEGVLTCTDYPDEIPRFVLLGFKPRTLSEVVPLLEPKVGPDCIVVSILAGVSADTLRKAFPRAKAIVRAMPNLPVAQIQGATAIYSKDGDREQLYEIRMLFASLGMIVWCDEESQLGVIGALASAGIAYVARFIDALALAGQAHGLGRGWAEQLAIQTLVGTSSLAIQTRASMAEIAKRVASPGGTTEQGLAVLDRSDGLSALVQETISAAIRRGDEMAQEATGRG